MSHETIELNQSVIMALDVYKPAKREAVLAEILRFVQDPANHHETDDLFGPGRLYMADMPTGLRVLFRTDEHGRVIEIVDYFRPWKTQRATPDTNGTGPARDENAR